MQDLYLDEGEVVFTEGTPATHLYFVVDGVVSLSASSGRKATFGPKSAIGLIDSVLERPLSWTAIVTRKAHLLRIRFDDWLDVLEDSFGLALLVIGNFTRQVHALRRRPPPLGGFDQPPPSSAETDG